LPRYSVAVQSTLTAASVPFATIKAGASARIAWSTIGTANAISHWREQFPATIGAGWSIPWSAMGALIVPSPGATGEIMIVNRGAGVCGTFNITLTWDE
jgi:hypothetical protein